MRVIITETGHIVNLDYFSEGIDISHDFIGNTGSFCRDFDMDESTGMIRCNNDVYEWWRRVINDYANQDAVITEYRQMFGGEVDEFVAETTADISDIEAIPTAVIAMLEERYGTLEM